MAKFLDTGGLEYLWDRIKAFLGNKVDKVTGMQLSTNDYSTADKNKLSGIAAGAQVNVVESVKRNGAALPISGKAVDLSVPTKISDLTNDSGFLDSATGASGIKGNAETAYRTGQVNLTPANLGAESAANKGVANGYAPLDASMKIPLANIPDTIVGQMVHAGQLNAATAVATLTDAGKAILGITAATATLTNDTAATTGYPDNQGNYFIVATAGTFAGISFAAGDWLVASASGWTKIDNSDSIPSVNGRTGPITLSSADVGLGNVPNKDATNPMNITQSVSYRFASDAEKSAWNGKADSSVATATTNGLMSYTDKEKLDGIEAMTNADIDAITV